MSTKIPTLNEPSEEELIERALSAVDMPPPDQDGEAWVDSMLADPVSPASPTLAALEESRRPQAKTVCEGCPNSVWFTSPVEVKCYCRVMFLVTWSSKEQNQITACDGIFLGQD